MMTQKIMQFLSAFGSEEEAVTAIEYALLAALIFAVIVTSVRLLGINLAALFASITGAFP